MLKNKKGFVEIFTGGAFFVGEAVFWGGAVLVTALSIVTQPQHIINRANEKCIRDGGVVQVCHNQVNAMTKEQRKSYIRDTQISPAPYDQDYGVNKGGLKI